MLVMGEMTCIAEALVLWGEVQYAAVELRGEKYIGARASMNVWNPRGQAADEPITSQIWLTSNDTMISLQAGWLGPCPFTQRVAWRGTAPVKKNSTLNAPEAAPLHSMRCGEARGLHVDGYKTNCYNLNCPGFVQTNHHKILDSILDPVSVYGGAQYEVDVQIFKDRVSKHWWVALEGDPLGYWPKELVAHMEPGSDVLAFGGEVYNSVAGGVISMPTQMGSGHVASEGFRKASFFKNVQTVDTNNFYRRPKDGEVQTLVSCSCYELQVSRDEYGPWGYNFYYGGPAPSASCNCKPS
ncbi:hypothetical protein Taro_019608 [Colocasia esculenta]|uniref:Neprosin PEP catalytic domain-containing protein n=1 Tax=Colocasia esculenta TaxID=4460 RepID=A0A843V2Q0_COLES|nr:hypothetical protein [Colocasia esculenta]